MFALFVVPSRLKSQGKKNLTSTHGQRHATATTDRLLHRTEASADAFGHTSFQTESMVLEDSIRTAAAKDELCIEQVPNGIAALVVQAF